MKRMLLGLDWDFIESIYFFWYFENMDDADSIDPGT